MQVGLMPLTWSLERIWLDICCPDTLKRLLVQSTTSELTITEGNIYIKVASKLTAPLIDAYQQMLDINVKSQGCNPYVIDHAQTTLADSDQFACELNIVLPLFQNATLLSPESRAILESKRCMYKKLPPTFDQDSRTLI
jgi:hypothetical protein